MTKEHKKLAYSAGVVVALVIVLYGLSFALHGGAGSDGALSDKQLADAAAQGNASDNSVLPTDPSKMYLGMKTWTWAYAKDAAGTKTTAAGTKPFTLSFDFQTGKVAVTTDCASGGGVFAAKSGVLLFGTLDSTLSSCTGTQAGVFTGFLAKAQGFYFSTKGQLVLKLKDGGAIVFQ